MTSSQMEEAALGGMTYARFFPSDWRTGCLTLNLEEEGLYIRICAYMYDTGKPLRDDYTQCAILLRVQPLKLRKVLESLIAKGKIIRTQGLLINERVQEEIDRFRLEYASRAAAAKKREEMRRYRMQQQIEEARRLAAAEATPHHTPTPTPHHTPPVRQGVPTPVTGVVDSKNSNEINGSLAQPWHGSTTNPESRSQKPEDNNKGWSTWQAEAPEDDEIVFEGDRVCLTRRELAPLQEALPHLDWARDLRIIERQVSRSASYGASREQLLDVLENALRAENNKNKILREKLEAAATSKNQIKDSADCWLTEEGRLEVANGFQGELLKLVGGDIGVLREHLDVAGGYVPALAKGRVLMASVRGQIAKQLKWDKDRRKTEVAKKKKSLGMRYAL